MVRLVMYVFIRQQAVAYAAYFCNSCSDALEITALAMDLRADDEVIIPDYICYFGFILRLEGG